MIYGAGLANVEFVMELLASSGIGRHVSATLSSPALVFFHYRPTHTARTGTEVLMETVLCHRLRALPHLLHPRRLTGACRIVRRPHWSIRGAVQQRVLASARSPLGLRMSGVGCRVAGYDVLRASHMQMQAIDSDWGAAPARRRLGETKSGTVNFSLSTFHRHG
jgi:hypothetical protein